MTLRSVHVITGVDYTHPVYAQRRAERMSDQRDTDGDEKHNHRSRRDRDRCIEHLAQSEICRTNFARDIWMFIHMLDSEEKEENTEITIELQNLSAVYFEVGCQSCAKWDDSEPFSVPHRSANFESLDLFDP